jgi:MarR family 2-MHQ and catechol resistance regulon transcriptional repressor
MKLEEAIQQTKFSSANQKITLTLIHTYNLFKDNLKNFFKPYGITLQQFNVLRILRGNYPEPYSTSQVRDRMLDKMSDASRIVDRLVKKDLVKRSVTKSDKRLVDVVISESGLKLLEKIDVPLETFMAEVFGSFSEKDKADFLRLMGKIGPN